MKVRCCNLLFTILIFQKPEKPAWTGVWDATYYRPACPQIPWLVKQTVPGFNRADNTSEDCLYMNIFVPNVSFIHVALTAVDIAPGLQIRQFC